jgi:putative DNA primase/helicase
MTCTAFQIKDRCQDQLAACTLSESDLPELDRPLNLLDEPGPHTKVGQQDDALEDHGLIKPAIAPEFEIDWHLSESGGPVELIGERIIMEENPDLFVLRRTDLNNAELFAALHHHRVRFDHSQQRWMLYKDHWWEPDADGEVMRLAKDVVRKRLLNSANIEDDDRRNKEAQWALSSQCRQRLEAMLILARTEKPLANAGDGWDPDGWLLGVANGLVDLRTGELRDGTPDDRITLHAKIAFDPLAGCPRWDRFLTEIFDGDCALISYVDRAVGYSLTGQTSEQCFFCCYGAGANGKSTFLNAIRHALASYSFNLPFSAFELAGRSTLPNDVATLPGRRFVTAIETDETARLNEARIKALTGGDIVTARQLYREFFSFKPVAKFWLAFNHPPSVADDSHGFWRRVHLIPFLRQFDPKADPKLEETLSAEAPGILARAVRGGLDWQACGLTPPAVVQGATQTYRIESDPLREFLEDRCLQGPTEVVSAAALREAHVAWARKNGEVRILNRAEFARRLEAGGFQKRQSGHARTWMWFGLNLK